MAEIGAFLSSEEHGPAALVAQAKLAEEAGIHSLFISDHFHPWIDRQGETGCGRSCHRGRRKTSSSKRPTHVPTAAVRRSFAQETSVTARRISLIDV
jgi:alkanesulfonate monooxygenase SsuD/methylene tetrahydromethanopterin reductase-like flavin-dependent oxidoreductase (luciferase family)